MFSHSPYTETEFFLEGPICRVIAIYFCQERFFTLYRDMRVYLLAAVSNLAELRKSSPKLPIQETRDTLFHKHILYVAQEDETLSKHGETVNAKICSLSGQ